MRLKVFIFLYVVIVGTIGLSAQIVNPSAKVYKVERTTDGKRQITGYMTCKSGSDKSVFANAMLWTVNNVCQQFLDKITSVNISDNSLQCDLDFNSLERSGKKNIYHCKLMVRVAEGKLLYTVSDVTIESTIVVLRKQSSLDRLNPEEKETHKEIIIDFEQSASYWLNSLFDFVENNRIKPVTHWEDIEQRRAVKGMTEDEVLLTLGKPLLITGNDEIQWKYGSSYFVFLKGGKVVSVLK